MIPKVIQHSPLNQKTLHHVSYPIALSFSKQNPGRVGTWVGKL